MRNERDSVFVAKRLAGALAVWTAASAVVAGIVIGLRIAADRLISAIKFDGLSLDFLKLVDALNFIALDVLLAPVQAANKLGWADTTALALALLSFGTWGALLLLGIRALTTRRRRTNRLGG